MTRPATGGVPVLRAEVDHARAELVGDPHRPRSWTLLLDGTAQSHVDLDDPTHLEFEYVRRLGHLVDVLAPAAAPLRVLHLGGGAWTLARYVAATRPGSPQQVVELDAALVDLVAARLPADGIEVVVADARAVLDAAPAAGADLAVLDVFAGPRIPAHLTTVECVARAAAVLAPRGVYAANLADAAPHAFARGQAAAFAAAFPHVGMIAAVKVLHGPRFGNLLLLGGHHPLPEAPLRRQLAADPFPARLLDDADVRRFAGAAAPPTDATAVPSPVPPPGFFGRPTG